MRLERRLLFASYIIEDYVKRTFPGSSLDMFVDRDRSGYTFDQREQYQIMRRLMLRHQYDILIVKDLSRFSRRNGQGLVELEYLRDAGIRIIAIGDNIDYPTNDDWLRIQIYFFMNEMPVTDTSKKVRSPKQLCTGSVDLSAGSSAATISAESSFHRFHRTCAGTPAVPIWPEGNQSEDPAMPDGSQRCHCDDEHLSAPWPG